jgi:hypothetical protein
LAVRPYELEAMNDWQVVTKAEPWLVRSTDEATVRPLGKAFLPTRPFGSAFPRLAELLGRARRSEVILPSGPHILFAWGEAEHDVRVWLSPAAPAIVPEAAAPDHRILLACFGGIAERFNEPADNWLLNHNQVLTAAEVTSDASFMTDYRWAFEECGGIPIDMAEYYPAAWEANGNCVLCARDSGQLLFFAPDHAYRDLVPYGQCPMYTLHTRVSAGTLREWVEQIAEQWLRHTV